MKRRSRASVPAIAIRLALMAAAVWWWSLLLNICSNTPQPSLADHRMIPFTCPVSGLAFITPVQRALLYGLLPVCIALMIVDFRLRRRGARS
jgi:hypothetical protein